MIYGLATLETSGLKIGGAGIWKILGGASYILYLVHQPIGSIALRGLPGVSILPREITLVMIAVISVAAAVALHMVVERPLLKFLTGKLVGRGPPAGLARTMAA